MTKNVILLSYYEKTFVVHINRGICPVAFRHGGCERYFLGDKVIFSTTDTDADNPDDDLSSYEYHFSASPLFFAKEIKVAERFETAGISEHLPAKDDPLTGKLNTNNLYRPPII